MLQKQWCGLVTFPTTTAAMELESEAGLAGLPGRLVPLPRAVSAGCGMAWRLPLEEKERLLSFLRQKGLSYEKYYEVLL